MVISPFRMRLGAVFLGTSALLYFACEAIAAWAWTDPHYSYARNYISDLGVPGPASHLMGRIIDSPLAAVMNVGFIGQGVLFLAGAIILAPIVTGAWRPILLGLAAVHAVGIALVGIVHGSEYSIEHGLFFWHSTGANMAIFAGNALAIIVGALRSRLRAPTWFASLSMALGIAGFVSLGLLALRTPIPDGIFERGAVYSTFAWALLVAATLLAKHTHRARATTFLAVTDLLSSGSDNKERALRK